MVFNDTANKNGIIQRIEDYAGFDDGVVSGDTTLLKKTTGSVNETVHEMTTELMLTNDDFNWDDPTKTDYPVATTLLVANQRDYQFDSISFLRLRRVDITYDGTHWVRATPFESAAIYEGLGNDTLIDQEFSTEAPQYDPKAFGFWLYPRATQAQVDAGAQARIEFDRAATEYVYTDTTKLPPIDRPFHDLIAAGAVIRMPQVPEAKKAAAKLIYGERVYQGDGSYFWTGGMGQMLKHYSKRNEDSFKSFQADLRSNYS